MTAALVVAAALFAGTTPVVVALRPVRLDGRDACRRAAEAYLDDHSWRATMRDRVFSANVMAAARRDLAELRAADRARAAGQPLVFVPRLSFADRESRVAA